MPDTFARLIQRAGVMEWIRGNTGVLGDGLTARDKLVPGTYNPVMYSANPNGGTDWNTTRVGIYGYDSLTSVQEGGNLTYSTAGQTYANTYYYRRISNAAPNNVYVNCLFRGTPTDYITPVTCNSASVNPTFIDCTFWPLAPQYNTPCARVGVGGGTFIRCDFLGGTDGVSNNSTSGWPQRWKFIQCAFHDMTYNSPDPDAAGGIDDNASHTDMIQWGGGQAEIDGCGMWGFYDMRAKRYQAAEPNVAFGSGSTTNNTSPYPQHMFGNKYTDTVAMPAGPRTPAAVIGQPSIYTTSLVMISPIYLNVTYFRVARSYLDGTTYAINVSPNILPTYGGLGGPFEVVDNKVGKNHRWEANGTNFAVLANSALHTGMTITGNVDLDTSSPLARTQLLKAGA